LLEENQHTYIKRKYTTSDFTSRHNDVNHKTAIGLKDRPIFCTDTSISTKYFPQFVRHRKGPNSASACTPKWREKISHSFHYKRPVAMPHPVFSPSQFINSEVSPVVRISPTFWL
jgi:hypothetical protein